MPTPGLPLPPAMSAQAGGSSSNKYRGLTSHRAQRASKEFKSLMETTSSSATVRKRVGWFLLLLTVFLLGSHWGYKKAQPPRPPFAVDKLPPPPSPPTGYSITPERKIPPIVHYVYGLSKDFGGKPFGFAQFVAMNSMLENIHPEKVMVWYKYEPQGWWWGKIKEYAAKKGVQWEMKVARDVDEVFGNKVEHFAHKADVIRLEALKTHGGIYLDSDVFIIKDFKPLYRYSTVMGMESQPDITQELPTGICNAIILAQPYAPFISRWLESYADFDRSLWATHSVARPWELARQYPNEITVLDKKAFFWPVWHTEHMQLVHETTDYDFDKSGQLAYHAWESLAWGWLAAWDPDTVWIYGRKEAGEPGETSLTRLARRWVPQELRNEWRTAKAAGLV